jgi:basic amino acid/polyamine antiporter, APA family
VRAFLESFYSKGSDVSENSPPKAKPTLGLTGLTSNAMALIAPGAFLWLTYAGQAATGAPAAGMSMWAGIVLALLLCLATAIAYAELSKLYPGAGSSYFFAEQSFLSKSKAFKYARLSKFTIGWASHLYYWVYPGVMVATTAIIAGYMLGSVCNHFNIMTGTVPMFAAGIPSPLFMILFCCIFAFGVAYIAYRGVGGTTSVNAAINVIQISALIVFAVMAIAHRTSHPEGSNVWVLDSTGTPTQYVQDTVLDTTKTIQDPKFPNDSTKTIQDPNATIPKVDGDGNPVWVYEAADSSGKPLTGSDGNPILIATGADGKVAATLPAGAAKTIPEPFVVSYKGGITKDDKTGVVTYNYHENAASVVAPHNLSYVFIQACIAILILVGFESVTSMGEEAKNPKRDIPKAVVLSLLIQGGFCYLFEYFAASYMLHNGYTNANASVSSAPIGDMMQLVGAWAFGGANAGWWFMMIQACTVFLALIGTTLSCMTTGARVTYAMGRDKEVPEHFGMLHGDKLTPHRAIWILAFISMVIGIITCLFWFCGPAAQADSTIQALPNNIWYKFGLWHNSFASSFPAGFLVAGLISNFGTFLLYMMTCIVAIVAFREHHTFNGFKHMFVPLFGLVANLLCMIFYLIGPFFVAGMSWKEPYFALGIAAIWGVYGLVYFILNSGHSGKSIFTEKPILSGTHS